VKKINDELRQGRVLAFLCEAHGTVGNMREALRYGHQAVAAAERLDRPQLLALSKLMLGIQYAHGVGYREALEFLTASAEVGHSYVVLDETERRGGPPLPSKRYARYAHTWAKSYIALCLAELGAFEEARACGEEALEMAESIGMYYAVGGACSYLAMVHLRAGDVERGNALLHRTVGVMEKADTANLLTYTDWAVGYANLLGNRHADAISWFERARERDTAIHSTVWAALTLAHLAEAYVADGRPDDAVASAEQAIRLAVQYGKQGHEAWARYALGEVLARVEPLDLQPASRALDESLGLARKLGMQPLEAQCLLQLSALPTLALKARREHLATATRMFTDMGMKFWLEKAEQRTLPAGPAG
jgi:tetratricopeptide (TPR) repeat protein